MVVSDGLKGEKDWICYENEIRKVEVSSYCLKDSFVGTFDSELGGNNERYGSISGWRGQNQRAWPSNSGVNDGHMAERLHGGTTILVYNW